MTMDELFRQQVEARVQEQSGPALIVWKGFGPDQIRYLIGHPNSLLRGNLLEGDCLNWGELEAQRRAMLAALMACQGPMVAFYEELLVLQDSVNDLAGILNLPIVVVENNALAPWTPSLLSEDRLSGLARYLQADKNSEDPEISRLSTYYSEVRALEDGRALVAPRSLYGEPGIVFRPFWEEAEAEHGEDRPEDCREIVLGSQRDWACRLDLLSAPVQPVLLLKRGNAPLTDSGKALAGALKTLGVDCWLEDLEDYEEPFEYDDRQFVPLLRTYWGEQAQFRPLLFYRDPDRGKELQTISQGSLIAEIADQCERAADGEDYHDIFITAPTGAGKSVLFQLPALYLHQRYGLVTIIISPLIALMNDQVEQLTAQRGIHCAACINSSLSMDERMALIRQIHAGEKSLIYLAPELLLSMDLNSFLGGRKVGLMVIDEAHTVTSWGRDFRSDYWFLGDFLARARRQETQFPVLCLTATAVYSGPDDVVNDTIAELGLNAPIVHLGNVRRDNIEFDIRLHGDEKLTDTAEHVKMDLVLREMRALVDRGEKTLAYFPYRSQVETAYQALSQEEHLKIRRYHGQLNTNERHLTERDYRNGQVLGLFCTKAFGMGVDVSDIRHVIHFAPTGTLADYVQEIGRAAREPSIQGTAHIDFYQNDMRYVRSLNGISEMRQYQLREMLKKLWEIYGKKQRRNLLLSSETFEYLFPEKEVENRTKNGLLLLAKDLRYKYGGIPVLIVRPRAMLSKNYVNIPDEIRDTVLRRLGPYAREVAGHERRVVESMGERGTATVIQSTGSTFLLDMEGIWENLYSDMPFGMFKKQFFEVPPDPKHPGVRISPRVRIELRYKRDYEQVEQELERVMDAVITVFEHHKRGEVKQFTQRDFEEELQEQLGEKVVAHDKISLLLDIFTARVETNSAFTPARSQISVLQRRKQAGREEPGYLVMGSNYLRTKSALQRMLNSCRPQKELTYEAYRPILKDRPIDGMPLFKLLELLDLASYEIRGGEKAQVFVRINDPGKIRALAANGTYRNVILQEIHRRHKASETLLQAFFTTELSQQDRWELIEEYFLGHEAVVSARLGLPEEG